MEDVNQEINTLQILRNATGLNALTDVYTCSNQLKKIIIIVLGGQVIVQPPRDNTYSIPTRFRERDSSV